jgi:hypothetical protein
MKTDADTRGILSLPFLFFNCFFGFPSAEGSILPDWGRFVRVRSIAGFTAGLVLRRMAKEESLDREGLYIVKYKHIKLLPDDISCWGVHPDCFVRGMRTRIFPGGGT